jgi:hypothetical protein
MKFALFAALVTTSLAACAAPPAEPVKPSAEPDLKVCPADVKTCSDGSYVVRNPAKNCAFALCPDGKPGE